MIIMVAVTKWVVGGTTGIDIIKTQLWVILFLGCVFYCVIILYLLIPNIFNEQTHYPFCTLVVCYMVCLTLCQSHAVITQRIWSHVVIGKPYVPFVLVSLCYPLFAAVFQSSIGVQRGGHCITRYIHYSLYTNTYNHWPSKLCLS